jgi:isoquinoline 1-oxidoreductase
MDVLARTAQMDPLEFRMKNLSDPRLRAVLGAATKSFGWPRKKTQAGQGFGLACGYEKGSYVGTCAEVAVDKASGAVRVVHLIEAFECGAIVNPDGLRNQNMGAIMMGIGGALFEAITFADGTIHNARFSDYRLPRFADAPHIEIILLDRKDIPSAGAGETGLVGLAPAVGNAIFAATGSRIRNMPMAPADPIPGMPPSPLRS